MGYSEKEMLEAYKKEIIKQYDVDLQTGRILNAGKFGTEYYTTPWFYDKGMEQDFKEQFYSGEDLVAELHQVTPAEAHAFNINPTILTDPAKTEGNFYSTGELILIYFRSDGLVSQFGATAERLEALQELESEIE